ncbi:fumarylacetoacetate hydrolase family protein [Corallococcus coralloides]|uniref:Fumarylacetoacetate hydrolase family protein n=1 Tax=Corallococcus coralloides TaxID=184914 RepID=A0A410S123_CORCK|nr:fumarylacetoacetate hydrolase family protein [Corallococcus coralloides]QAT87721.1 fumarylacetoacetate hydrolase family protein [Corallococcus coralloides]
MTARYCRFQVEGRASHGRVDGNEVVVLTAAPWAGGKETGLRRSLQGLTLLTPSDASKVVCIGQNYRKHAEEMGKPIPTEPLIFTKPSTALNGPGSPIRLPKASQEVHYEAELALVISERLKNADEATAARAIWGLTCFNDVTARDIQRREIQHTRAKGYDTFACAGPWAVTGLSPADLRVVCRVNGQVRQDGRTSDMVFSPARLVSFISHIMTLLPGDLVSTGTPSGVGALKAGDTVEVELEGIGTLVNPVEMEP